jgi:hypothetical protein
LHHLFLNPAAISEALDHNTLFASVFKNFKDFSLAEADFNLWALQSAKPSIMAQFFGYRQVF